MSRLLIRVLALSSIGVICILCVKPIVRPAGATVPPGYTLVWSDEFNGTALDTTNNWGYRNLGPRKDGVNIRDAVSVGNGLLTITTYTGPDGKHYTGMIGTGGAGLQPAGDKFMPRYGYMEASIDFDGMPGMWSSFWMQSDSTTHGTPYDPHAYGTEMDIVEHRVIDQFGTNISNRAPSSLHWDNYTGVAGGDLHYGIGDLSSCFHTYGLEWTPSVEKYYYDGQLVWTVNDAAGDPGSPPGSQSPSVLGPVSHRNEYMLLCSEVLDTTVTGATSWCGRIPPGNPPGTPPGYGSKTASTTKMKVDYVRFYQLPAVDNVVPSSVTNLAVSNKGNTSMAVTWNAPGDDGTRGTATQYNLRYSTTPINATNFPQALPVTTGPPHVAGSSECRLVTGLSPCRTYYFAIKTRDEANNWSGLSNLPNFTTDCSGNHFAECDVTPDVIAPANVTTLGVPNKANTSMAVTWTAPGDDGATGTATEYDLRYSTSSITTANFCSANSLTMGAPRAGGSVECRLVTGLSVCTTYYFAIMTKDEAGNWSGLSNPLNATTDCSGNHMAYCGEGVAQAPGPRDQGSPLSFSRPYPNPVRGATSFRIPIPGDVQGANLRIEVFDVAGRRVRSLVDRIASQGPAQVEWNLLNDSGQRVASGVYMVRVSIGDTQRIFPLVVLR